MYRAKPWRIFQLSGYGSPEEMAERLQFLLEQGETGFIMKRDRVRTITSTTPTTPRWTRDARTWVRPVRRRLARVMK